MTPVSAVAVLAQFSNAPLWKLGAKAARADWVIDLGPEGGTGGGRIVAAGPPDTIVACTESWTGRALAGLSTSPDACS